MSRQSLDEQEQLQLALQLSREEAQRHTQPPAASSLSEDELLARQLQEAEYTAAQQQHAPAIPSSSSSPPGLTPAAAPPAAATSSSMGTSSSGRLVDSLKAASSGAMQRLSSGGRQLVQGVRQLVDGQPRPPPASYPPPHYQYGPPPYAAPPPPGAPIAYGHPPPPLEPLQQGLVPTYTQPPPAPAPGVVLGVPAAPPPRAPSSHGSSGQQLADDEALAAALQRQFDLEDAQQQQQQQQTTQQQEQPRPQQQQPRPQQQQPRPQQQPPLQQQPRPQQQPPLQQQPRPPQHASVAPLLLPPDPNRCAGCGGGLRSLFGASPYLTAMGRRWHTHCFVCAACGAPIANAAGVAFVERDGRPYHGSCHKQRFHPLCSVCGDYVPEEAGRKIVWSENPFWRQRYCPRHDGDGTPRCSGCARLQPAGEQYAGLEDGRHLCLECLDTACLDTREALPLWHSVLSFFASLGCALPSTPPMMLVDGSALQEAEGRETRGRGRGGGPVFHVRGLTLTEEYRQMRSILRLPGGNPFAVQRESVALGPTRHEVTAILVLYGLPRLLTGSILAHETCHAYLRMCGYASQRSLEPQVEEGLCQLLALLWLEAQQAAGLKGAYEERLQSYLAHEIRTDGSEVYGDGLRLALEAFQAHGLAAVLAHVRATGALPDVPAA